MGCGSSASPAHPGPSDSQVEAELLKAGWLKKERDAEESAQGGEVDVKKQTSVKKPETKEEVSDEWVVDPGGVDHTQRSKEKGSVLQSSSDYERALQFSARIPLLREIPRGDLPLIVRAMQTHEYKVGEAVLKQGHVSDKLFIVISGKAEVVVRDSWDGSEDTEKVLMVLSSGDYFGEQELLLSAECRATVRVIGEETLSTYSITHDVFFHLELHERLHIPKRHAIRGGEPCFLEPAKGEEHVEVPKNKSDHDFLIDALRANTYLPSVCDITEDVLERLVMAAVRCTASAGEVLFRKGDLHINRLCIVESGAFEFEATGDGSVDGIEEMGASIGLAFGAERLGGAGSGWHASRGRGDTFGEMELFLSLPARATVTAGEDSVYWTVGRVEFTHILASQLEERVNRHMQALRCVRLFAALYNEELKALAKGATEISYNKGEDVVTEGEKNDACYILVEGKASQIRGGTETGKHYAACSVDGAAHVFGGNELMTPGARVSTVRIASENALVLCIDRETIQLILEPLEGLSSRTDASPIQRPPSEKEIQEKHSQHLKDMQKKNAENQYSQVKREDLEFVGNLGSGQFGYVDLAVEKNTGKRFAFKRVHQKHLTDPYLKKHVKQERRILMMTNSPFVVQLYATYKEPQSLTFLMELVTGGDLRNALYRDKIKGEEDCARFYCAGLVLAVEHLHQRHIVHRDLKPDNIMLDENGWPKVADFGLAKFCVGKTFTVTGTPNYMAPECFHAAGHGLAVDWWSLGCITYELMAGKTPFESALGNFQQLYRRIQKGIPKPEKFPWPRSFGTDLPKFLFCLLQTNPSSRLPTRHDGIAKLQAHSWYEGFDWTAYGERKLKAPVIPPSLGSLQPSKNDEEKAENGKSDFDRQISPLISQFHWDDDSDRDLN